MFYTALEVKNVFWPKILDYSCCWSECTQKLIINQKNIFKTNVSFTKKKCCLWIQIVCKLFVTVVDTQKWRHIDSS